MIKHVWFRPFNWGIYVNVVAYEPLVRSDFLRNISQ